MSDLPDGWAAPLARLQDEEISPEIALTLVLLADSEADPGGRLATLAADRPGNEPLARLVRLVEAHPARVKRIQTLIAAGIDPVDADGARARLQATREHFDRLAAEAPEAAVALYSLGDPDLLAAATAELIEVIERWTDLNGKSVLDFGCGIGRVAAVIAPLARQVTGIDVSPGMIEQARARASGHNLHYQVGNGADLAGFPDASIDLMLAVDSFPYLVRAGDELVRAHVGEASRLLRAQGELMVFNWSYRGDLEQDAAEARLFGQAAGLRLVRAGEQPFRIWNGAGFHFVRE